MLGRKKSWIEHKSPVRSPASSLLECPRLVPLPESGALPKSGLQTAGRLTDHIHHVEMKTGDRQQCRMRCREISPADAVMLTDLCWRPVEHGPQAQANGVFQGEGVLCASLRGNVKMSFIALCVFFN